MTNKNRIGGILQIGIGTTNMPESRAWYSDVLGFSTQALVEKGVTNLMLSYTGGVGQERQAAVIMNMAGGGGFETWQYLSRTPMPPAVLPGVGDLGILAIKLKVFDLKKAYNHLISNGVNIFSLPQNDPIANFSTMLSDPFGNYFQLVENANFFSNPECVGGVLGAIIGCSDLERSIAFYSGLLGYECEEQLDAEVCPAFKDLRGGDRKVRRALLRKSEPKIGGFSRFLGPTEIELVQTVDYTGVKMYEGRLWGDPGYIHICFDVRDMDGLKSFCAEKGSPFTIDSFETEGGKSFEMGKVTSRVAYIDDPDGTPIEFVETHRLPILPALGISVNLKNGRTNKNVPDWLLKLMRFKKVPRRA